MNEEDLEMRPTILKRENIALREKLVAFQDIFEHLLSRTEHVSHDTVQRLSAGTEPSDVLKTLRGELPHAMLSEQAAARAILPPVHSDGELELLVRHPKAYCALDLPVVAHDTVSSLFLGGESSHEHLSQLERVQSTKEPSDHPKYCDARLEKLNIEFWTSVPLTNEDAASAISLYLETHHPVWCFFDASQFLGDLTSCRIDSESTCSPLMVSALLAFALVSTWTYGIKTGTDLAQQGYSSINPAVAKYSYQLEEQAEKLFAAEGKIDALPSIAALALLYTSIATHGDVPKAIKYLTAAREAADRMNLFGKPDPATYGSPRTVAAASQAAWGLFNFLVYAHSSIPPMRLDVDFCFQTNGAIPGGAATRASTSHAVARRNTEQQGDREQPRKGQSQYQSRSGGNAEGSVDVLQTLDNNERNIPYIPGQQDWGEITGFRPWEISRASGPYRFTA
jgi:hypothetical protein